MQSRSLWGGRTSGMAVRRRGQARFQTSPETLFFVPDQFLDQTAALFLAVEKP